MNALVFAWRSLVRQPARGALGVLGVAAVGALLFDMLLLSQGLVVSMRDLLERTGYDIRVSAGEIGPVAGPLIEDAAAAAEAFARLPSVRSAVTVRLADAQLSRAGAPPINASVQGAGGSPSGPWTILRGRDPRGRRELVLNEHGARTLDVAPGSTVTVRAFCSGDTDVLPPVVFHLAGVAEFPFDSPGGVTAGTTAIGLAEACGGADPGAGHMILVASALPTAIAVADIEALRPDLLAFTNEQAIARLQERGFTYFRQISTVLSTITLSFALLLIATLLTVSVNQRLGEIAALRALGLSQRRVVADVLCESSLIVGIGGVLSLPFGALLAAWLDSILKRMPGIPANLHFFVFEPHALGMHVTLLSGTAVLAALYPMWIVARLPIAATLRNEVIS